MADGDEIELDDVIPIPSPPTRPWLEPLPVSPPLESTPFPLGTQAATRAAAAEECGRGDHQAFDLHVPTEFYEMHVREALHRFHPDLPIQAIWGFNGRYPGPTVHAHHGAPILCRIYNDLSPTSVGYGSPEISTHVHNLHAPSESDGFPGDFFSPTVAGPTLTRPGRFRDHHYPMVFAGGDPREALGTLWYHDHRMDFTAGNVVRGMAGFYLVFDELDSGDENDPNPAALRLPSGEFDVPMILQDKRFGTNGLQVFDQFNTEGVVGDKICVNGKILPYLRVQPRKYRLRILNGGPLRFYELVIERNGIIEPFQYIANDGNLLPAPLTRNSVLLGMAERADIVVDFSRFPVGSRLFLRNRLEQRKGRGPEDARLNPGTPLLRFDVIRPVAVDFSRVPETLRPLEPLNNLLAEVVRQRKFRFKRDNNVWVVNNEIFDPEVSAATVKRGTTEIWELESNGNWHHPIHIHFEEGRILSRNGQAPPPHERGRKDVYVLRPDEKMKIVLRFRDFLGKYPVHCHNLVHEDHSMMFRFDIVP